jgi:sirohydrochlorin ferrochelatase
LGELDAAVALLRQAEERLRQNRMAIAQSYVGLDETQGALYEASSTGLLELKTHVSELHIWTERLMGHYAQLEQDIRAKVEELQRPQW